MQQVLDESWFYYEKLKKIMNCGIKNVKISPIYDQNPIFFPLDQHSQQTFH